MFTKNSGLVKVWVELIEGGQYTVNDVPNLANLREVVESALSEKGGEK